LQCADLDKWLPPATGFDLVVLANIHPAPELRRRVFSLAASAVAPGGHIFVVGHHLDDFGLEGPSDRDLLFTEGLLRDAFPGISMDRLEKVPRVRQGNQLGADMVAWGRR